MTFVDHCHASLGSFPALFPRRYHPAGVGKTTGLRSDMMKFKSCKQAPRNNQNPERVQTHMQKPHHVTAPAISKQHSTE